MTATSPRILLLYNQSSGIFTALPGMFAGDKLWEVDVLSPVGHIISHSRLVSQHYTYESDDELWGVLKSLLETGDYTWMHVVDESSRRLVYSHTEHRTLARYLNFAQQSELHSICDSKVGLHQWFVRNELPVPRSVVASSDRELLNAADVIQYPCMLKGSLGSRGDTVFRVTDAEELLASAAKYPEMPSWLVQEYLSGQAGTTTVVCMKGVLYAHTHSLKLVCLNGGMGISAVKRFIGGDKYAELAAEVVQVCELSGMTGYDWIEDAEGRVHIMDAHFGRAPSSSLISAHDDVDVAESLLIAVEGAEPVTRSECKQRSVWLMPQAVLLFFEGRIGEALKAAFPLLSNVTLFRFHRAEWRLFIRVVGLIVIGQSRVKFGAWRRKLFCRS